MTHSSLQRLKISAAHFAALPFCLPPFPVLMEPELETEFGLILRE